MRVVLRTGVWMTWMLIATSSVAHAQDLLTTLENSSDNSLKFVTATFKSTRVINTHSVETLGRGELDFRISHRFGRLNSGAYNFFGLDEATIRLALEYGISDRITAGIGRSSFQKTVDGFIKVKVLRQSEGQRGSVPVSMTWFSNMAYRGIHTSDLVIEANKEYKLDYAHQLIIARKFGPRLSLQLAPILVHHNLTENGDHPNDVVAIASGGRMKVSKRLSINADYIYRVVNEPERSAFDNSLSLGVDIETGGHVFQLHLTNSQGMIEELFATRTSGRWSNGDIFYGFNVSRRFSVTKRK